MLYSLTPFRLATSAIGLGAASRKIRTICSSLYRLFFMLAPCLGAIFSNFRWSENTQAGQDQSQSRPQIFPNKLQTSVSFSNHVWPITPIYSATVISQSQMISYHVKTMYRLRTQIQ